MNWNNGENINPDEWFGFIYRITNLTTGRMYIGKKQFHNYIRKKVKGRKNRKHTKKESNWKSYTSSSKILNGDIKELGIENFLFEIEYFCKSRSELHYTEIEMQVEEDVLRAIDDNGDRLYYNGNIAGTKFLPPATREHSAETCKKISMTLKGRPLSKEHIANRTKSQTGEGNPFYGKKHSQETLDKIKNTIATGNRPVWTKPVTVDGVQYKSVTEAYTTMGISKNTFHVWKREGKIEVVYE